MDLTGEGFVVLLRVIAIVQVVYGIPFMLRLVPPNRFFGFKMPSVIPDADAWYYANRILGVGSVITGAFVGVVSFLLPHLTDEYPRSVRVLIVVAVVVVPLSIAVSYTRRKASERLDAQKRSGAGDYDEEE
ncbi:MAG: SdpI family protein [Spirochaetota bacterium]